MVTSRRAASILMIALAVSGLVLPGLPSAAQETRPGQLEVKSGWHALPKQAGTYRITVTCPRGSRAMGGEVEFQEVPGVGNSSASRVSVSRQSPEAMPSTHWPRRHLGGSIGQQGRHRLYAELVLDRGPALKVRLTARCRV